MMKARPMPVILANSAGRIGQRVAGDLDQGERCVLILQRAGGRLDQCRLAGTARAPEQGIMRGQPGGKAPAVLEQHPFLHVDPAQPFQRQRSKSLRRDERAIAPDIGAMR